MTSSENDSKRTAYVNLSPCVKNCCLNENDICIGCFRHLNEITGWRELTEAEQQNIVIKCKHRKSSHNQ
ncbi:DUF1289 domain-containing protein [Thalassotalea profundi]|uniref:DUF1289 domain-containing protein n=1 Tax=Thalassotalea profundi TaxID=2036687 RepID=A0ABQ3J5R5_9GAMM|nr:DUF1289 domain-containing protein [Thalassotalea profundi]GHF02183.1 hypothetical protein GCM10011501_34420 [Thalassotalea profundi]